jgi:hypothetical protein
MDGTNPARRRAEPDPDRHHGWSGRQLPERQRGTPGGRRTDAPRCGSGKGDIFYNARWQFVVNGLYQLPGNFEVGTSVFGRQGYVYPVYMRLDAGGDGILRTLAVQNIDDKRYDNLWDADFRLAWNLKFSNRSSTQLTADLFNAFNSGTILGRNRQANGGAFGSPTDVLAPLNPARLGIRLNF